MKKGSVLLIATICFISCTSQEELLVVDDTIGVEVVDYSSLGDILDLPSSPFNYADINLPAHFSEMEVVEADNTPNSNPVTNRGATLGRVLFYDKAMSLNNTTACASCHTQETGFTDPNALSIGFEGQLTGRNSMSLANARFFQSGKFFWDERAATLEDQVLMPIQDHIEMGMTLDSLEKRLSATDYYPVLFQGVFGDSSVTAERISFSLSQFVRSMVSYQSRFDEALEANGGNIEGNMSVLSGVENLGKDLFFGRGGCDNCHESALFIADEAFNNGLEAETGIDDGVGAVTGNTAELGLFKVPSLRNVALGAPYMHDGRFATLREVVEHYNIGVEEHPNLSRQMRDRSGSIRRLNLSDSDIEAMMAFMETLTDQAFVTDEKFSDPFISN